METGIIKLDPTMLSLFAGGNGGALPMPYSREIFVLNVNVAGTTFCDGIDDIAYLLKPEMVLKMRRDTENEADDFAIGIYYDATRIGWVPMDDNLVIAHLMDAGKAFNCKVVSVKRLGSWVKINVSIYMID